MMTPPGTHSDIDTDTFATYSDALQAAALTTTRLAATTLPTDLSFYRSIDPALAHGVDAFSDRILTLANKLVHVASGKTSRMRDEEDVLDDFVVNVVDPMDGVLESTDSALDVFLGKRKDPAIHVPSIPVDPHQKKPKTQQSRGRLDPALTHASYISKPQLLFKHTHSNTDESPYIPATLIPHKWCAKVPLGYFFHDENEKPRQNISEDGDEEERRKRALHPYYYELTHPSYPDHVFDPPVNPLPPSLDIYSLEAPTASHPLTFVSTPEAFLSMANGISHAMELAVDLEHHSYRSYKGFLALMQISTRQEDFIIDLLVPEIREGLRQAKGKVAAKSERVRMASEAGQIIARVFADPSVIKVFHGAESDIVWLQQDFNIFVVGLFDTFHASKILGFPKHSLAYLLETYCDFIPDKRYQLADWRIRPLPAEMSTYARSDTHFLLYIYDMLRISLIERPSTEATLVDETGLVSKQAHRGRVFVQDVLSRSARTALRLYESETYDTEGGTGPGGWDTLAKKWNKVGLVGTPALPGTDVPGLQAVVYRTVHRWREDMARQEDESTRYVLPTHYLFLLSERLPTSVPGLMSLFAGPWGGNRGVPPVLKRRIGDLMTVIKGAMEVTKSTTSPQGSKEIKREAREVVVPTAQRSSATDFTDSSSSVMKPTHESRLWSVSPSSTTVAAISISCSSLFGGGISGVCMQEGGVAPRPSVDGQMTCFSTGSTLFGSAIERTTASSARSGKTTFTHARASGNSAERFKDLMDKIHKTLVIAPVVSTPTPASPIQTQTQNFSPSSVSVNAELDENDTFPGPAGQIEIPFVPAHKRQTFSDPQNYEVKDDIIVVVGQARSRQRKRKRDRARVTLMSQSKSGTRLSGGAETFASIGDRDQESEGFDYSSVPNLLDDEGKPGGTQGVHEEDERRKKKQRHGKGSGLFECNNFRASPRDQREVRSGNKTHTFR